MVNSIEICHARLGNLLFINFILHLVSKKFDYLSTYNVFQDSKILGFNYNVGSIVNPELKEYTDTTIFNLLQGPNKIDHGIMFNGFGQLKDIILTYKDELNSIIERNFEVNNEVFVHIRLDDSIHNNPGLEYYRTCLNELNAASGYISSDSPEHEIVKTLISEFNLKLYNNSPVETLNFAKTFDKLVLSSGTFSWWIGVLSKASKIYYPIHKIFWHGDIFVFPDWNGIDLSSIK